MKVAEKLLRMRLYLAYARFRRGVTLGVRVAVLDRDNRVFLVRHSYVPGWYFPGGGVERGEAAEAAMARELMEEGGIRIDRPAELFGFYLNRANSASDHVAFYVSRDWTEVRKPKLPNYEILEARFFPLDGLPDDTTASTRRRLNEIAGTAPRSPDW